MKQLLFVLSTYVCYSAEAQFYLGYNPYNDGFYTPIGHGLGDYIESDNLVCFDYSIGNIEHYVCNYKSNGVPAKSESWLTSLDGKRMYMHGLWCEFYPNGMPIMVSNYVYGCMFGSYGEWYANGQEKVIGQYWLDINDTVAKLTNVKNDTITLKGETAIVGREPLPLKHGLWQYYDSAGALINEEVWNKGVLVE